ncbi:MAG TPA: delta-60 repeat domain-containing protein, partial [Blastocatellia bacterium]
DSHRISKHALSEEAFEVAIQSDGKIIAAGSTIDFGPSSFALARYNTDGTLDASFGTGGRVTTDFDLGSGAYDVAIQPDGKILAAGVAFSNVSDSQEFAIVRYNADGSLDSTFGSGGKVTTDFFGSSDVAFAVIIQGDGKIVLGGTAIDQNLQRTDFALARYNTDGSLDTSFGSGGKITTDFFGRANFLNDLALQPDGKLIATGTAFNSNGDDLFALSRYNVDGSLDPTFGSGGKVTTLLGIRASAVGAGLQPSGKIVVAGDSLTDSGVHFALAQYNTDGTLDSTFGSSGKVISDVLGSAVALAIYPDGKIVVGGITSFTDGDFILARYNTDGSIDTTFGSSGNVTTDFSGDADLLKDLTIQPDGKIIAAGGTMIANSDFALARYDGGLQQLAFDRCIQDESNGSILQFNSTSGDYQFTNCSGITSSGTGSVMRKGGIITLQHNAPDRRVLARVDTSVNKATANIQLLSQRITFTITDRNTANNTCACR